MKLAPAEINKIAVFRALQLGDILCSIPALRNLRLAYPMAEITFIGLPSSKNLIERFSSLFDHFMIFPGYPNLPEQEFDQEKFDLFLMKIRSINFDLILQMQGNGTIVNSMLTDFFARNIAGFSIEDKEIYQNPFLLKYPNYGHESTRHLKLMEHLEIPIMDIEMEFPLDENDEIALRKLNLDLPEKYICIHPGSRGKWRQWPLLYFAQIADLCVSNGYQVVLTGTKEENDLALKVDTLMKNHAILSTGKTDLGTLGVLLKNSSGLISNCTGISHIAAGLKVPSVVISMDGEPERWAPLNKNIHKTLDWTKQKDYKKIEQAVMEFLIDKKVLSPES